MYIVKGGFSTLKQIKGSPRTRCLKLHIIKLGELNGNSLLGGESRHISVIGAESKQQTGTAVDKTELNFGSNIPSLFSFSVN